VLFRSNVFTHPGLRLSFSVPEDWKLANSSDAVQASAPDGNAKLVFDMERDKRKIQASRSAQDYLTRYWAKGLRLSNVEAIKVGGYPAATGAARVQLQSGGSADLRLVAVGMPDDSITRFMIIAPAGRLAAVEPQMIRAVNSLRYLTPAEAAAVKPLRLKVVPVNAGDTVESLGARMPTKRFPVERFRVLNGLRDGETIKPGERVKLVE
jgi:predicted Zn-dependent protease